MKLILMESTGKASRMRQKDFILENSRYFDEAAVQKVFLKSLDNYIKWRNYMNIPPVWSNLDVVSKEKKLLFISLYFLIWGEAANIRFIPECLCYIFHHMGRELEEIL
uniref:Callose synthase 9-like n=1 Tax=Nicotiana sylvestris TaxID=4096 RepID=A0A1U7VTL4_NICSY|nr:PREDICTED: callose synthase 9-like [Nicotiana sylvestris]